MDASKFRRSRNVLDLTGNTAKRYGITQEEYLRAHEQNKRELAEQNHREDAQIAKDREEAWRARAKRARETRDELDEKQVIRR